MGELAARGRTGRLGFRAALQYTKLFGQRYGDALRAVPLAGVSQWRSAVMLSDAMASLERRALGDPELARLRRARNRYLCTAALFAMPAAYCVFVAVGRALHG